MSHTVQLKASDGFMCSAYVAMPKVPVRGAVVVVQEIFGVNTHIRAVADSYALAGFLAVAPATFDRVQKGVEIGYTPEDMAVGFDLKGKVEALAAPGVMADLQAAVDYAGANAKGKVAMVGYCWGGLLTWRSAELVRGLSAAVPYYGGGMTMGDEPKRRPRCPVMAHFGDKDHWISLESVEAFKAQQPEAQVYVYEADHGFNFDHRGSYDVKAADLALERTLGFIVKEFA
jgi:carboxymethylenebutenolidase